MTNSKGILLKGIGYSPSEHHIPKIMCIYRTNQGGEEYQGDLLLAVLRITPFVIEIKCKLLRVGFTHYTLFFLKRFIFKNAAVYGISQLYSS